MIQSYVNIQKGSVNIQKGSGKDFQLKDYQDLKKEDASRLQK